MEQILKTVNEIFRDILGDDTISINADSTANDVTTWTSLTHIQIIVAIERHYNIRFKSMEITGFKKVGDMCRAIESKIS